MLDLIPEDLLVVIMIAAGIAVAEAVRRLDERRGDIEDRMHRIARHVAGADERGAKR